jgi:hypothetical protein
MFTTEERELLRQALTFWGPERQLCKALEELGELIVELARMADGQEDPERVAGEVADVQIMLAQLELMLNPERVAGWRQSKLHRLRVRLSEEAARPARS